MVDRHESLEPMDGAPGHSLELPAPGLTGHSTGFVARVALAAALASSAATGLVCNAVHRPQASKSAMKALPDAEPEHLHASLLGREALSVEPRIVEQLTVAPRLAPPPPTGADLKKFYVYEQNEPQQEGGVAYFPLPDGAVVGENLLIFTQTSGFEAPLDITAQVRMAGNTRCAWNIPKGTQPGTCIFVSFVDKGGEWDPSTSAEPNAKFKPTTGAPTKTLQVWRKETKR